MIRKCRSVFTRKCKSFNILIGLELHMTWQSHFCTPKSLTSESKLITTDCKYSIASVKIYLQVLNGKEKVQHNPTKMPNSELNLDQSTLGSLIGISLGRDDSHNLNKNKRTSALKGIKCQAINISASMLENIRAFH